MSLEKTDKRSLRINKHKLFVDFVQTLNEDQQKKLYLFYFQKVQLMELKIIPFQNSIKTSFHTFKIKVPFDSFNGVMIRYLNNIEIINDDNLINLIFKYHLKTCKLCYLIPLKNIPLKDIKQTLRNIYNNMNNELINKKILRANQKNINAQLNEISGVVLNKIRDNEFFIKNKINFSFLKTLYKALFKDEIMNDENEDFNIINLSYFNRSDEDIINQPTLINEINNPFDDEDENIDLTKSIDLSNIDLQ